MIEIIKILSKIQYDGHLSATAYIILSVILIGIISVLGWCFYRAITATDKFAEPQLPDEIGDNDQ